MFRAAAEGRPLELQKRLVLGKLAGGVTNVSYVGKCDIAVTPLDAAIGGGHAECAKQLEDALQREQLRQSFEKGLAEAARLADEEVDRCSALDRAEAALLKEEMTRRNAFDVAHASR